MPGPQKPRLEWEIKTKAGRIYVTDDDDYDSSFQMNMDGDEGVIHTLNGRAFFKALPHIYKQVFDDEITSVRFTMRYRTLIIFKKVAKDYYKFHDEGIIRKKGRVLFKVRITLKEPATDDPEAK